MQAFGGRKLRCKIEVLRLGADGAEIVIHRTSAEAIRPHRIKWAADQAMRSRIRQGASAVRVLNSTGETIYQWRLDETPP
jgi:hypothetical protein